MIYDNIKNLDRYMISKEYVSKIEQFIEQSKKEDLEEGRYSLEGDNLLALIQKYETKIPDECRFESHINYIDIQYIERGKEIINWIDISKLNQDGEYNEERDILFYYPESNSVDLKMEEDMFAIFLEHDGHRARCIMEKKSNIKKILFKVKINR